MFASFHCPLFSVLILFLGSYDFFRPLHIVSVVFWIQQGLVNIHPAILESGIQEQLSPGIACGVHG